MAKRQLGTPPSNAVDLTTKGDVDGYLAAISGATTKKTSELTVLTGQALALTDKFVVLDVSDTTQGAAGSLDAITAQETLASFRRRLTNNSVSNQSGFASDTYVVGSDVTVPTGLPIVRTQYRLLFDIAKTAAGTATPIIIIRMGTAGTTADTATLTFTFGAGTAALDRAIVEVIVLFRTVGSGTSAVATGIARAVTHLATTGWSNAIKSVAATSAGFDSTTITKIGASYNGGTSASHTVTLVDAELIP